MWGEHLAITMDVYRIALTVRERLMFGYVVILILDKTSEHTHLSIYVKVFVFRALSYSISFIFVV